MFIVSAVSLFHNKEKTMQNNQLDTNHRWGFASKINFLELIVELPRYRNYLKADLKFNKFVI